METQFALTARLSTHRTFEPPRLCRSCLFEAPAPARREPQKTCRFPRPDRGNEIAFCDMLQEASCESIADLDESDRYRFPQGFAGGSCGENTEVSSSVNPRPIRRQTSASISSAR